MADIFTKAKRSEVMSRIRSRGNKDTEVALGKLFRRHGITGWRRQVQVVTSPRPSPQRGEGVKVRPDFIFPKLKLAVFVDGCFWHGCPRHATKPKSNRAFWNQKLKRNKERDRFQTRALRRAGWQVIRVWECALKKNPLKCVERIQRVLL